MIISSIGTHDNKLNKLIFSHNEEKILLMLSFYTKKLDANSIKLISNILGYTKNKIHKSHKDKNEEKEKEKEKEKDHEHEHEHENENIYFLENMKKYKEVTKNIQDNNIFNIFSNMMGL